MRIPERSHRSGRSSFLLVHATVACLMACADIQAICFDVSARVDTIGLDTFVITAMQNGDTTFWVDSVSLTVGTVLKGNPPTTLLFGERDPTRKTWFDSSDGLVHLQIYHSTYESYSLLVDSTYLFFTDSLDNLRASSVVPNTCLKVSGHKLDDSGMVWSKYPYFPVQVAVPLEDIVESVVIGIDRFHGPHAGVTASHHPVRMVAGTLGSRQGSRGKVGLVDLRGARVSVRQLGTGVYIAARQLSP
jgi:hypothetical protein